MNIVFIMDPLESINFSKDTTFVLMLESHRRKHTIFYVPKDGLSLHQGGVLFNAVRVIPQDNPSKPFIINKSYLLTDRDINAVFIRPDPPFDEQYLMNTWILDHLPKNIITINSPRGIRIVNEKIWAAQFSKLTPPTLITRDKTLLNKFINSHLHVIAKPTNAFGGQSVFQIRKKDENLNVILETLTNRFTTAIILQQFIKEARQGDKRILLLNGEILGALLRVHGKNDHRNNFFAGGKPLKTTITQNDLTIVKTLKPYLINLGLYFVGMNILGDRLIEVNVTSPTCVQEINRLYGLKLEEKIIDFLEKMG